MKYSSIFLFLTNSQTRKNFIFTNTPVLLKGQLRIFVHSLCYRIYMNIKILILFEKQSFLWVFMKKWFWEITKKTILLEFVSSKLEIVWERSRLILSVGGWVAVSSMCLFSTKKWFPRINIYLADWIDNGNT